VGKREKVDGRGVMTMMTAMVVVMFVIELTFPFFSSVLPSTVYPLPFTYLIQEKINV